MSLTTEHLPSLKEEKEQLLDWLWTFLKNILIFYCECISVFVFILGPAYESLLHITISKKAMDIGRRAGSKFKFLFFLLLGQRKWIMLKTAEGNSWKGSKWTALENRSKWYDLSVKLGSCWHPSWFPERVCRRNSCLSSFQSDHLHLVVNLFLLESLSILFPSFKLRCAPIMHWKRGHHCSLGKNDKNCSAIISCLFFL